MGLKTLEHKLIKLFLVLGSLSVKILEAFVNDMTSVFVFQKIPSPFNESDIFFGSVVGRGIGAVSQRGLVFVTF